MQNFDLSTSSWKHPPLFPRAPGGGGRRDWRGLGLVSQQMLEGKTNPKTGLQKVENYKLECMKNTKLMLLRSPSHYAPQSNPITSNVTPNLGKHDHYLRVDTGH